MKFRRVTLNAELGLLCQCEANSRSIKYSTYELFCVWVGSSGDSQAMWKVCSWLFNITVIMTRSRVKEILGFSGL